MDKTFSKGVALAIWALVIIKKVDAFVPPSKGSSRSDRESQTLFALPKIIKKGEKVETEVDKGGVVGALVRFFQQIK